MTGNKPLPIHPEEAEKARKSLTVTNGDSALKNGSSHLPPAMMHRSSSTASNHSAASGSATTATSRRGGRIRSRSPPSIGTRPASTGPADRNQTTSPKNGPSSAAAAAAAAAKALSNSQPSWFSHDQPGRHDPSKFHYDTNGFHGSSWPNGETNGHVHNGHPGDGYRHPGPGPYMNQGSFPSAHGNGYAGPSTQGDPASKPPPIEPYESGRLSPPHAPGMYSSQKKRLGGDGFGSPMKKADEMEDPSTPATVKRRGTSRIMGTATPIHVPRVGDDPQGTDKLSVPNGSAASVFRGAPAAALHPEHDVDSPTKILLSLRTPSHSFEERDPSLPLPRKKSLGGDSKISLSPDDPPQIQNSHQKQPNLDIFDPHRSPNSGTLEMAPSFSLFNASFDSLGDGQLMNAPLDGALQNNSFGMATTGSLENVSAQPLPPPTGQAGGSQSLASNSPQGGTLTLGMSPVNSFGNGTPGGQTRRPGGNTMVLGGGDPRSASPTQVLGMYPSYSGGYPPPHGHYHRGPAVMMNDPYARHMNLSGGSFGGLAMSHSYTRSFEMSPHSPYGPPPVMQNPSPPVDGPDGQPHFYGFLRRNKAAFIKCSFLLPGLKAALLESPLSDSKKRGEGRKGNPFMRGRTFEPSPQDTVVATRRVVSAIFAFGGSVGGDKLPAAKKEPLQSIFRDKDEAKPPTVTPSTPQGSQFQSRARMKYEEMLPNRYYENENRLSWEFEESPPIEEPSPKKSDKKPKSTQQVTSPSQLSSSFNDPNNHADDSSKSSAGSPGREPGGKMRYRCKLCGQPKQNHVCAYMKSLQRSIGVMIYPAVNAFTANEPGFLSPALAEMNNHIPAEAGSNPSSADSSPSRPGEKRKHTVTPKRKPKNVTPESMRSASPSSMASPSSRGLRTPKRRKAGGQTPSYAITQHPTPQSTMSHGYPHSLMSGGSDDQDLLFVEAIDLRPGQFREVITSKAYTSMDAFNYPSLPLPYAQRKRLSDNLFALSKEVPKLTDECAIVLREAREKDMWDLAVSELMTQVVVVIHCAEHDTRFEGLRQYLLTLGISC